MVEGPDLLGRIVDEVGTIQKQILLDDDIRTGRDDRLESVEPLEPIPTNGHGMAAIRHYACAPEVRERAVDHGEVTRGVAGSRN